MKIDLLPDNWQLPSWDYFYDGFRKRNQLFSMTEPDWNIAQKYLSEKRIAIDIGAHIGTTAIRYALNFENVIAFEPVYTEFLEKNTNKLNNIKIHSICLSDNDTPLAMIRAKSNSGLCLVDTEHALKVITSNNYTKDKNNKFAATTLDSFCYFENVDFIKIDTEGYIFPILKGAEKTIFKNKPLLQIEFNSLCPNQKECEKFLYSFGYNFVDKFDVDHFYQIKQ